MKAPTTLPEALAEIEGLRSQVHDLLQLLRQGAQPIAAGVNPSPAGITGAYEFSEGLVPNQAEKEAAQHLRDLHQMIETVPDVIFKLNLEGNLTGWNKRLAIVTGFSAQELNGRPALAFVPEHEHGQTAAAIQRAFEDGYAELEGHLLTKDGRAIPYHWTGAALKDKQGLTIGITGVGRDISERTKTEAQLREMNLALSQAMQGIARLDLNGRYVEMNDLYASMLGYLPTELIGQPWEPTVHPEDRYLVHAAFEDMQKSGRGECEARATRKDGSVFWKHVFLVRGVHEATPSDHHCLMREVTDRKQAESALRQSEAHFRALIEQSSDIITVLDPDGTVRFESPSFERLLGYKQHELDGQIAFDFIHPDDLQTVLEKFQLVVQCPDLAQTAEFRFRHRDGSWLALEGIGRSVVDADGQCLVIVNSRDVTERKRAENALSRSYDLLKSFVEHTPAAVAMLDKDLRYIAVSRRWYQDYRLGNQDLIGRHHYDVFPEIRSIAEWQTIHQRCLGGAVERREEDRFVRADGSEDWLRWEVRPWHDETDHIGGLIMFTEVITERKQAEQALADSEARFRTVVEGTSDWMWETDAQGRYTYSSPRVRDLLGYEPEEILSKTPFDFMLPEEAERVGLLFSSIVEARSAFDRLENTQRHKDGHLVVLECRGVPILDADGTLRGYRGFDRDVTIQKQAEQALRASEERYARATAIGKVGVWELDVATGFYHGDVNLKALFGYEPDELSTDPFAWLGLVHPEDQSIALKAWEGIVSGTTDDYYYELRMIRKDGTLIWTDVRGHAERDEHGHVQRLIGTTVDITERKQADTALRISQMKLRQTLQASNTGLWDWNTATNEVVFSSEWKRQLGYEDDEIAGRLEEWESRLHPGDRERALTYARAYREEPKGDYTQEFRLRHKDGSYRWIAARASFVPDSDGRHVCLLGSHVDITDRKQAELALQRSEAHFRALIEHSSDIITVLDLDGKIRFESPSFERLLGYAQHAIDGLIAFDFIHPGDLPAVLEKFQLVVQRPGESQTAEFRFRHKDGSWLPLEGIGRSILDTEGRRCVIVNSRDVTERKRVEDALIQRSLQQQVVAEFGHFVLRKCDLQTALDEAVQRIAQTLGTEYCKILELQPGGTALLLRAGVGWHHGLVGLAPVSAGLESQAGYTLVSKEPVIVENLETDRRFNGPPLLFDHGVISGLSVIIRGERQPWGVLGVHTTARRSFTQDDVNFVQSMANILGSLIERHAVEETLAHHERELRTVLDALPVGVWFTDRQGQVLYGNPVGQRIWSDAVKVGLPDPRLGIRHWEDIEATDLPHRWAIGSVLTKNQPVLNEMIEIKTASGSRKTIRNSTVQVRSDTGAIQGAIVLNEDITERKQAEAALLESEERFRTLVGNIPGAVYRCAADSEWTMSYLSNAIEDIVGYPAAEFIGNHTRSYASVIHPDDRPLVEEATWASLREHRLYAIEYRLVHANGTVRWVYEKGQGVFDPDGEVRFLDGAIFDITERKQADELLRLTQFSVDRAVNGVFWVAPDGRILSVNEAACRMLEYSREELTAMTVHDIDPQFSPESWSAHWEHLKQKESMTFESKHWSRTGRVLETEVTVNYLQYEGREYNCAIMRDIGERKRAEAELRQSHAFIRQVIDIDPNFIFAKDRDGRFTLVNKAVAECYGTTVDELIGKSDADFTSNAQEVAFFRQLDLDVMDSLRERFIPEEPITDSTGRVRWLQTVKRPILDDQGRATMVLGASTEITERKRVEAELRQREQDLRRAGEERERISEDLHDGILQSIYAIGLGLEACKPLVADLPKKSAVKLNLALQRTIGQLNHVLEEVRNFIVGLESQILDGQEFDTVLRTMVHTLAAPYPIPYRIAIEQAAAQNLSTEQAYHVMNIAREALSNSLRHSGATRITVSLKRLRRSVRLSVVDNGVGFNPAGARDVGHGLANMAARTQKIGGKLTLQSKARQGAKVLVDIPRRLTNADT